MSACRSPKFVMGAATSLRTSAHAPWGRWSFGLRPISHSGFRAVSSAATHGHYVLKAVRYECDGGHAFVASVANVGARRRDLADGLTSVMTRLSVRETGSAPRLWDGETTRMSGAQRPYRSTDSIGSSRLLAKAHAVREEAWLPPSRPPRARLDDKGNYGCSCRTKCSTRRPQTCWTGRPISSAPWRHHAASAIWCGVRSDSPDHQKEC